jgi:hypothetical protein
MINKITWVATTDFNHFGPLLKEQYESVYVKMGELMNIIKASESKEVNKFTVMAGEYVANLFENSRTYCFSKPPDRSVDPFIGTFRIEMGEGDEYSENSFEIYLDKNMPRNRMTIEGAETKCMLVIENIPQLEGND